ncbi:MAG: TolC family protein, partial [Myxococcota bacterium]
MRASWIALAVLMACAGTRERETLSRFRDAEEMRETPPPIDGRLDAYVAHATAEHPSARAAFERWRAATHRIATERGWPRPTISYAAFLRPVETRVGPQRQRVGLRVPLAWPGMLRGRATNAAELANAAGQRFSAEVLALRHRVADAYWTRWLLEARARSLAEQQVVLQGLAELVQGRVAVGEAAVGDLQTIEVRRARLADAI